MLRGGHVAAGMAKALHQTQLDRMSDERERDRDIRRGSLESAGNRRARRDEEIGFGADELVRELG